VSSSPIMLRCDVLTLSPARWIKLPAISDLWPRVFRPSLLLEPQLRRRSAPESSRRHRAVG
jgi:hypothetical protein